MSGAEEYMDVRITEDNNLVLIYHGLSGDGVQTSAVKFATPKGAMDFAERIIAWRNLVREREGG